MLGRCRNTVVDPGQSISIGQCVCLLVVHPPPPPLTSRHSISAWQVCHPLQPRALDNTVSLQLIHTPLLIFNNDLIQVDIWYCSYYAPRLRPIWTWYWNDRNATTKYSQTRAAVARHYWLHFLLQILPVRRVGLRIPLLE